MESPEGSVASKGGFNVDLEILGSDLETLSAPTMEGLEELITVCSFAFPLAYLVLISGVITFLLTYIMRNVTHFETNTERCANLITSRNLSDTCLFIIVSKGGNHTHHHLKMAHSRPMVRFFTAFSSNVHGNFLGLVCGTLLPLLLVNIMSESEKHMRSQKSLNTVVVHVQGHHRNQHRHRSGFLRRPRGG